MRLVGLTQSVPPATEPVTIDELRDHLRVDSTTEDALITALGTAAREMAETFTGRQFVTATWVAKFDDFPGSYGMLTLPRPTLQTVSSVTYRDITGTSQTLASSTYDVVVGTAVGYLIPADNDSWPSSRWHEHGENVTVTYTAGYGVASAVPESVKAAIKLMVGDMYEHREARLAMRVEDNPTVKALLWSERVMEAV